MPDRADMVKEFLRASGLRAWIGWRPDELVLLTGRPPYWGVSVVLYFAEGERILFIPEIEPRDTLPAGVRIETYPWGRLDCPDPFAELVNRIRSLLADRRISPSETGCLRGRDRSALPVQSAESPPFSATLEHNLASLAAADPTIEPAFLRLYLRKTPEEIAAIRRANQAALAGIAAFQAALAPGRTEAEVAAAAESAVHCQTGAGAIGHAGAWAMVQSGPNTADAGKFNRSTGRRLEAGDLVLLELATCVDGYWSDLTRTAAVGETRTELRALLRAVEEASGAAIRAARPGVEAGAVDTAARAVLAQRGLAEYFTHATGHHVGFRYHDPGFMLAPGETQTLEAGMVITIEPGAYVPALGGGARIEQNILITGRGSEILSDNR